MEDGGWRIENGSFDRDDSFFEVGICPDLC
jgi:hypothetical protein